MAAQTLLKKGPPGETDGSAPGTPDSAVKRSGSSLPSASVVLASLLSGSDAREQFDWFMNTAQDALVILSSDGRMLYFNTAFERITGFAREEFVGKHFTAVLAPKDAELATKLFNHLIRTMTPVFAVLHARSRSGVLLEGEYNASPLMHDGKPVGAVVIARDQTERWRAERLERELAERIHVEQRLHEIAEAIPYLVHTIKPDGVLDYANTRWRSYTGISEVSAIPESIWSTLLHPEDQSRARERWKLGTQSNQSFELEARVRAADGGYRWFYLRNDPVMDQTGKLEFWLGTAVDIEEKKRAADSIEESEERFRLAFEEGPSGMAIICQQFRLLKVNRTLCRMLDCSWPELLGKPVLGICHPDDRAQVLSMLDKLFHSRDGVFRLEVRYNSSGGRLGWMLVTLSAVTERRGGVLYALAHIDDITDKRRDQARIQNYISELSRSNAELEHFAYVISHDLREPLRMVASYARLLQLRYHDRLDAAGNEFIGFAVEGAGRMHQLIGDLLELSRINRHGDPFLETDANKSVQGAVSSLAEKITASGARVTWAALPRIRADEKQLARLFHELIENAIKFRSERPPDVRIAAERGKEEWIFSVKDNGMGIAPDCHERIFIAFQRLHGRQEYPGTGIGLAICKKIVERHRGRIWVESIPGVGSAFHFTLPDPDHGGPSVSI